MQRCRHNSVRDVVFSAAQTVGLAPRLEVPPLIQGTQIRPADVFLPNWARGHPAALNITVISPLQQSTFQGAATTQGHCAAGEGGLKVHHPWYPMSICWNHLYSYLLRSLRRYELLSSTPLPRLGVSWVSSWGFPHTNSPVIFSNDSLSPSGEATLPFGPTIAPFLPHKRVHHLDISISFLAIYNFLLILLFFSLCLQHCLKSQSKNSPLIFINLF